MLEDDIEKAQAEMKRNFDDFESRVSMNDNVKDELDDEYEELSKEEIKLQSHIKINSKFSGEVVELKEGYAKISLTVVNEMIGDEFGLAHSGFLSNSGSFCALAAVNSKNGLVVGSECKYLAPIEVGDVIEFEGLVNHQDSKKRDVRVIGKNMDIKVFEGRFFVVVMDRHILKTKIVKKNNK